MELKRHLDPKKIFIGLYMLALTAYVIIGLQPAEAVHYDVSGQLNIPSIGLASDVTTLTLSDHKLDTPDTIVGAYSQAARKTLLIGHSTTVFTELDQVKLNADINYSGQAYRVIALDMVRKSDVDMQQVLSAAEQDTLIIMTCAGQLIGGGDSTHRLMVTAIAE